LLEEKGGTMRSSYITSDNHRRLQELLLGASCLLDRDREAWLDLQRELNRARIVPPRRVPPDVVTMHSQARVLDVDTGEEMLFKLVFPEEADIEAGDLSVLAPLGTAILGYRAGDTLAWRVPAGERHLKVLEVVYQPEANGVSS
jgi:regulator of nucleoside diphosphate kinase